MILEKLEVDHERVPYIHFGQIVYGPGKAFAGAIVEGIRSGRARIIGSGNNHLPLTHVDDAAASLAHVLDLAPSEVVGRTIVAAPATTPTQQELYATTAAALERPVPKRAPLALAALIAGRIYAEVMSLDARCDPDLLSATGFTFRHESIATGIPATLAAMETTA